MINGTFRKLPKDAAWFTVRNQADGNGPVEILLYDQIGRDPWDDTGMSAREFADALNAIPADRDILLRIHSPGGNVWDALAMHSMVERRKSRITAQIDGVALSAASWIGLAANKVTIPKNGRIMVHDAQGFAMGDASEMRNLADFLDRESDNIADIYARKSGGTRKEWRKRMQNTTWFSGAEAVSAGLVDQVTDFTALNCAFDLSSFGSQPPVQSRNQSIPMKRKTLIRILKNLGIAFSDNATDAELIALVEQHTTDNTSSSAAAGVTAVASATESTSAVTNDTAVLRVELDTLRTSLNNERQLRIGREIGDAINTGRIPAASRSTWIARAMADETILNDIRALPAVTPGCEPVGMPSVVVVGNTTIENYQNLAPGRARRDYLQNQAHYDGIRSARREHLPNLRGPRNANTLDTALIGDFIVDAVILVLQNRLAPLAAFSSAFSSSPMKPRATVQVAKGVSGSSTQTNPTNFETGDSVLDNIAVTMNQISQTFHLDNDAINQGFRLSQLAEVNAFTFANALSDVYTALMIAANYGAATVIGSAANFDATDLPAIFALAKNYSRRQLLLDGSHLAQLIPKDTQEFSLGQQGAYGFDLMAMQNRWTGGVANIVGFVCDITALAVASGIPINQPSEEFLAQNNTTVPQLGLTVQSNTWYSRAGRKVWSSYDIVFGAAVGDGTAAENLVTA